LAVYRLWVNLQAKYDLEAAEEKLAERIEMEVQPMRRAS
jgi:plasmid maintenance system antidote protein VapI